MRKFKAVDAVCIMVLAGIVGFFIGAFFGQFNGRSYFIFDGCGICLRCSCNR